MASVRLAPLALSAAAFVACTIAGPPDWRDQLAADSPCYDVDLSDGLDEASTAELRDTYACINASGNFGALSASVDALEARSRDGVPAGVEVARAVNRLPDAGVDPWVLASVAVEALRADDQPFDDWLDVGLELTYGTSAARVRAGHVDLDDPAALNAGVLAPLAPAIGAGAGAMLDDDLAAAAIAGELVADPETKRWLRSFAAMADSDDDAVAGPIGRLLPDLGDAIAAARDDGDSLRDAADVFVGGDDPLLAEMAPEAYAILDDVVVRTQLEREIVAWSDDGTLRDVPGQLVWMTSVDVDGGTLTSGEVSGLHALIRLLHDTNQPMKCSLDTWFGDLEIDLGNLAVAILNQLADTDPDTIRTGVDLLGGIIDADLSQDILEEVAESRVCPVLTEQVVHDLKVIDLVADDRAYDLLVVFTGTLAVLKYGETDHIADFADLATTLYGGGGVEPVEALIRDAGTSEVVYDVLDLVPVFADPGAYGISAGDDPAVDLQDALTAAVWLVEPDADGVTGFSRLQPLVAAVLAEDGTWAAIGHLGAVLAEDGSRLGRGFELVGPLLALDPELEILDQLAPLLEDRALGGAVLRAVETDGVVDTALATEDPAGGEVPLAFGARLVTDGTVDDVLAMVDIVFRALDGLHD